MNGYLTFLLWYAGPFIALALLWCLIAFACFKIRQKNEKFDRWLDKVVPILHSEKLWQPIIVTAIVAFCLYAWSNGWGVDYD